MKKVILSFLLMFYITCLSGVPSTELTESDRRLRMYIETIERAINEEKIDIPEKTREVRRINEIADRFNLKSNWLLKIFLKESNLDPKRRNKYTGATGLIQFMPGTARCLGVTTSRLRQMSFLQQLDYVEKYLEKTLKNKTINSYEDLYLSIFYPKGLLKKGNFVIGGFNSILVKQNKGMDMNKDNKITFRDFEQYVQDFEQYKPKKKKIKL